VRVYIGALHEPTETSRAFYAWGGGTSYGSRLAARLAPPMRHHWGIGLSKTPAPRQTRPHAEPHRHLYPPTEADATEAEGGRCAGDRHHSQPETGEAPAGGRNRGLMIPR
jgi:hypothetical protein